MHALAGRKAVSLQVNGWALAGEGLGRLYRERTDLVHQVDDNPARDGAQGHLIGAAWCIRGGSDRHIREAAVLSREECQRTEQARIAGGHVHGFECGKAVAAPTERVAVARGTLALIPPGTDPGVRP